ncbi:MAG TPA: lipid-binding SYLF domain-containing protein [Terriglobales bacterium]|nr:lipid-binding SYLF domain-containing protein [Terriglobales bacterium]
MKRLTLFVLCSALLFFVGCAQTRNSQSSGGTAATTQVAGAKAETYDRLKDAGNVLNELMSTPDQAVPEKVLADAKCVAVVPSMVKGGFIIGARHGRGVATCRTRNGWSAPAFFTITGGSWGPQIGVEAVDLVMLFMNEQGTKDLLSSKFNIGADASVAAGPVGRDASASTDVTAQAGILTYSRSRGLFAGLTLNGANVQVDDESQDAFYGRNVVFSNILTGKVTAPAAASTFLATVRQNFREARTGGN